MLAATALRLERAIAIYLFIARRWMMLAQLGRTVPELHADGFFASLEPRYLAGYAERVKLPPPGMLQEAILLVAPFGGYLNPTPDGPPGHAILWCGLERLSIVILTLEIADAEKRRPALQECVDPDPEQAGMSAPLLPHRNRGRAAMLKSGRRLPAAKRGMPVHQRQEYAAKAPQTGWTTACPLGSNWACLHASQRIRWPADLG